MTTKTPSGHEGKNNFDRHVLNVHEIFQPFPPCILKSCHPALVAVPWQRSTESLWDRGRGWECRACTPPPAQLCEKHTTINCLYSVHLQCTPPPTQHNTTPPTQLPEKHTTMNSVQYSCAHCTLHTVHFVQIDALLHCIVLCTFCRNV